MKKTQEAVNYLISVWNEVSPNWREKPDHVRQKFIEAEKELQESSVVPAKHIREIISYHCGGTPEGKQKAAEEIITLFRV